MFNETYSRILSVICMLTFVRLIGSEKLKMPNNFNTNHFYSYIFLDESNIY